MPIPVVPRERVAAGELAHWRKHHCPPDQPDETPDRRQPDVVFHRELLKNLDLPLPFSLPNVGNRLPMWVIADPDLPRQFPSPAIRVRQGQLVHTVTKTSGNGHTIHHYGIEPTPMNDGVGKNSFEIKSEYAYQWQADMPGTYFYHCHRNTPLHFEMGLYGLLIVDPPEGPGFVAGLNPATPGRPVIRYDVEALWVPDDMDSRWHVLGHSHAMLDCGDDPNDPATFTQDGILHDFRPDVFTITGAVARNATTPITDRRAAVSARAGQTILARLLNASYSLLRCRIGLPATVVAADGRAFGVPPFGVYSRPISLAANQAFTLSTARRWDLIIRPTTRGTYPVVMEFLHWSTGRLVGTARTTITVT
jgi:FtsP/CotA-like multicopper oxidase with cupredoxin domain